MGHEGPQNGVAPWFYRQHEKGRERVYRGQVTTIDHGAGAELSALQAAAMAALLQWAADNPQTTTSDSDPT